MVATKKLFDAWSRRGREPKVYSIGVKSFGIAVKLSRGSCDHRLASLLS